VRRLQGRGRHHARTKDGKFGFTNTSSAAYWGLREALDPDQPGGSDDRLPPDKRLMAGLCAPTYEVTSERHQGRAEVEERGRREGRGRAPGLEPERGRRRGDGLVGGPAHGDARLDWIDRR
jgi:hypothetical protein